MQKKRAVGSSLRHSVGEGVPINFSRGAPFGSPAAVVFCRGPSVIIRVHRACMTVNKPQVGPHAMAGQRVNPRSGGKHSLAVFGECYCFGRPENLSAFVLGGTVRI